MEDEVRTERIQVELPVRGASMSMVMGVPADPVPLRRMLPILRTVSNSFISIAEQNIQAAGDEISCRAGCGACCRQLVPVSEAEAFDIAELVDAMPEPKRSAVRERFSQGFAKLDSAGYFDHLAATAEGADDDYDEAVREYFRFGVACPFLENESCSIHEARPVTCREYLVTSPPELCDSAEGTGVNNVQHYFKMKEALISASRTETSEALPYVPLIGILDWADRHSADGPHKTGKEWIGDVFSRLLEFRDEGFDG